VGFSNNFSVMYKFSPQWLKEPVFRLNKLNWLYQIVCFLLGKYKKKLTYEELFLLLYGLNRGCLGDEEAKKRSMLKVIEIYKEINNIKKEN
jgi:hypothetical protein